VGDIKWLRVFESRREAMIKTISHDNQGKNILRMALGLIVALLISSLPYSCSGRYLSTESAAIGEIKGTYTVILYGGLYANDVKTIAILAMEGTGYTFDVYAPDFDYKIKKGVPYREAIKRADEFVSFHHAFHETQWRKIVDAKGDVIGYEVRPLYYFFNFGKSNILDVYYKQTGDKVVVYIRLDPHLETMPFEGDKSFIRIR
jgi:hypothetical protein